MNNSPKSTEGFYVSWSLEVFFLSILLAAPILYWNKHRRCFNYTDMGWNHIPHIQIVWVQHLLSLQMPGTSPNESHPLSIHQRNNAFKGWCAELTRAPTHGSDLKTWSLQGGQWQWTELLRGADAPGISKDKVDNNRSEYFCIFEVQWGPNLKKEFSAFSHPNT